MDFKLVLAVNIAKTVKKISNITGHGGTSLPGKVATTIYPRILETLSKNMDTVIVTGTNGKTSTVSLLTHILTKMGATCISNREGANLPRGITTAYVMNTDLTGKINKKYAIIECDEMYLSAICKKVNPTAIIITNLYKDQVDRMISPDTLANFFAPTLVTSNCPVVLNSKNPWSQKIYERVNKKMLNLFSSEGRKLIINEKEYETNYKSDVLYEFENVSAAVCVAGILLNDTEKASKSVSGFKHPFGRMDDIMIGTTPIKVNLAKNTVGAKLTLDYIKGTNKPWRMVIGINKNTGDGEDASWLYDVGFCNYLESFSEILIYGMATPELKDIFKDSPKQVDFAEGYKEIITWIKKDTSDTFLLINYTCMMDMYISLAKDGYVNKYWEN